MTLTAVSDDDPDDNNRVAIGHSANTGDSAVAVGHGAMASPIVVGVGEQQPTEKITVTDLPDVALSQGGIIALGSTSFDGTICRRPAPLVLNGGGGIVVGCRLARGHDEPCQVIVLWR